MSPNAYYPSMIVNFKLRFDEALVVQVGPKLSPLGLDGALSQTQIAAGQAVQPLILQPGVANTSFIYNRIPRKASVELPGYRQAGQFTVDIDYKDMPIDPRTVRSGAVEIHLGTVSPDDFAAGVTSINPDGSRSSVLNPWSGSEKNLLQKINSETLLMVGMIDEWHVETTERGSICTLKGRDLRGLLIDTPVSIDPKNMEAFFSGLATDEPINKVVESILFMHPAFRDVQVIVNEAEWPNGEVPAPWTAALTPRHRKGARTKGNSKKAKPKRQTPNGELTKISMWDLIVRLCYLVGAIPYFRGADLLIRPAHSIYDQANAGTALNPTPFRGGQPRKVDAQGNNSPINPPLTFRRLAYGRDINTLSFDRKFAGYERPHVVRVVCVDGSSALRGADRLLQAVWPPGAVDVANGKTVAKFTTREHPGGKVAEQEVLNIPVAGITDVSRLQEIARGVFEEIGRGEMGGSCSTPNCSSFGGDNSDPDLLRLRPGDGVEFVNDTRELTQVSPLVSTVTEFYRNSFETTVQEVASRLTGGFTSSQGRDNLARVIVATARGSVQQVQRFFRVANVKFDWSEKGVKTDFDFQNYIVVRDQFTAEGQQGQIGSYPQGTADATTVPNGAGF